MPDKRNPSKQRRQARNRASRDSLAARRENAVAVPSSSTSGSSTSGSSTRSSSDTSSRTTSKGSARGTGAGGRGSARPTPVAAGPPPKGIVGYFRSKRAGDKAILLAFLLSFVSAIALLVVLDVPVDDRGEALPTRYGAMTIMARETLTGLDDVTEDASILDAYGPQGILMAATPVLIAGYALWANRRNDRSRLLTFALIAMAMASLFTGGLTIFLPTLIALGVGTFRIRKADMVAGMAAAPEQSASRGSGTVIETDTVDADTEGGADDAAPAKPKSLLDRLLGPGAAGAGRDRADAAAEPADQSDDEPGDRSDAGDEDAVDEDARADVSAVDAPPADQNGDDPLAELEAELAAEADAEEQHGESTSSGERSSRRRR